ncbi:MAG: flagellar motor protein MotB [Alphaproteobacteria bacterium]|nr:flagellar motor protein MotB [Alphaproteobacteria bacterium]
MAQEGQAVIIVKKVKKGGHGHHGGAWKVAYADFVTAMMAFFLLLWLLNAVTEEQLQGVSNYFAPTTVSKSTSGAGGLLGGKVIGEGASASNSASPSITMSLPPTSIGQGGEAAGDTKEGKAPPNDEDDAKAAERHEQQKFQEAAEKLKESLETNPDLQKLKRNLLVDNTAEGLRIQILDQEGTAMFPSGGSAMYDHTKKLLTLVAQAIAKMPEKISISGHTDSVQFADPSGYTNWELSADRALAARRVLLGAGVDGDRVERVVGRADTDPLVKEDPAAARNRRLSIVLLRTATSVSHPPTPLPEAAAGTANEKAAPEHGSEHGGGKAAPEHEKEHAAQSHTVKK